MRSQQRWALLFAISILSCKDDDTAATTEPASAESAPKAGTGGASAAAGKSASSSAGGKSGTGTAGASGSKAVASASGTGGHSGNDAQPKPDVGADSDAGTANPSGIDVAALKASGVGKYIGAAKPAKMDAGDSGVTTYTFDIADGPRCLRGDPYAMSTRKQDSENLLIYLQGGGSCSSAVCSANTTANANIPAAGITSASDADNPVASWNLVYVPYCDGSLHYGDKDHESESPPRYHHGLRNLSAALDVGVTSFPKAKKILLAGSSAGGLGTIYASMLVRLLYPDATLFVFNDSGSGISTPDGSRAKLTRDEWGTQQLIPTSCSECLASPHSTPVITWDLGRDPELRVGFFSAYEDSVLADTFLMIGGPAFKQAVLDETGKVVTANPERAKRFFIEGQQHTTAGNLRTMVNGVNIGQWLGYMLEGDAHWTDTLQ